MNIYRSECSLIFLSVMKMWNVVLYPDVTLSHLSVLQNVAESIERCIYTADMEEMLQFICCSVVSQPSWYCIIQRVKGVYRYITLVSCSYFVEIQRLSFYLCQADGGYLSLFVCLWVGKTCLVNDQLCLQLDIKFCALTRCVCEQNCSESCGWIFMKFLRGVCLGKEQSLVF